MSGDVLALNCKDVRALPLVERQKLLRAVVPGTRAWSVTPNTSKAEAATSLRRYASRPSRASSPSTVPAATARTNRRVG
jgi:ATP-dependent DNA ligase